jgi:hypothetical protein
MTRGTLSNRTSTSETRHCKICQKAAVPKRQYCRTHIGEEYLDHRKNWKGRLDLIWLSEGASALFNDPTIRFGDLFWLMKTQYDEYYPQTIGLGRVKEWYDYRLVPQGFPKRGTGRPALQPILSQMNPLWDGRPVECPNCGRKKKGGVPWTESGLKHHITQTGCLLKEEEE